MMHGDLQPDASELVRFRHLTAFSRSSTYINASYPPRLHSTRWGGKRRANRRRLR
jgi:hypothetical protein